MPIHLRRQFGKYYMAVTPQNNFAYPTNSTMSAMQLVDAKDDFGTRRSLAEISGSSMGLSYLLPESDTETGCGDAKC